MKEPGNDFQRMAEEEDEDYREGDPCQSHLEYNIFVQMYFFFLKNYLLHGHCCPEETPTA